VENNETFAVTLRNAAGAAVERREAFAVIDDDEQLADMKVDLTPTADFGLQDTVTVSDLGPRGATDVKITFTRTPGAVSDCYPCGVVQLASGASTLAYTRTFGSGAMYKSAIVTARQRDPQPANNAAGWVITGQGTMIMNGLYLAPGGSTQVTLANNGGVTSLTLRSSDPTVVTVPPTATFDSAKTTSSNFTITALKPGTATISVISLYGPLSDALPVTVLAAGARPRWPVGMSAQLDYPSGTRFDLATRLKVALQGTAPMSGAPASGIVTVSRVGRELARKTLAGADPLAIEFYPDDWGQLSFDVAYLGDANFLPQTQNVTVFIVKGSVTLTGAMERVAGAAPGTFAARIHAHGSPAHPPTGTISFFSGGTLLMTVPLTPGDGESVASTTLYNLPASPTITASYSGDSRHGGGSQEIRVIDHRRSVGH
jgi:hypothetical protein